MKIVSVRSEDLVQDLESEVSINWSNFARQSGENFIKISKFAFVKVKQLLREIDLKYGIATKKLVHRLEFPDEHIAETPGRVSLISH